MLSILMAKYSQEQIYVYNIGLRKPWSGVEQRADGGDSQRPPDPEWPDLPDHRQQ